MTDVPVRYSFLLAATRQRRGLPTECKAQEELCRPPVRQRFSGDSLPPPPTTLLGTGANALTTQGQVTLPAWGPRALMTQGWVPANLACLGKSHHSTGSAIICVYLGTVHVETARGQHCPTAAGPVLLLARLPSGPPHGPRSPVTLPSPSGPKPTPVKRDS